MAKLDLKRSILLTVAYSGVFAFPLTLSEIRQRLLKLANVSWAELAVTITQLINEKKIRQRAGFFAVKKLPAISQRLHRKNITDQKLKDAQRLIKVARILPWIKGLAISGSAAVDNAKQADDVDWLVITAKNSVWLVRPWLLLIAGLFGKRRERNGHHRDNSWCFNLFLDDDHLALPEFKRSAYTAYEVCQARFLYAVSGTERAFLQANSWAQNLVPTYFSERLVATTAGNPGGSPTQLLIIKLFNHWLYQLQYAYMKPYITREFVAEGYAYFHPRDTKKTIYRRWVELANFNHAQ